MSLQMSQDEREAFLAGVHVGVMSIERADGPPLTVPVWYDYQPGGDVVVIIGEKSLKNRLLNGCNRFSLCAQQEALPYKYVSVEGPITSSMPASAEDHTKPMAIRYLGEELGTAYAANGSDDGSLRIAMTPERWFTTDYGKM